MTDILRPAAFALTGPLPGTGTTVLEASAGTGKTYTIAGLVTRYVAMGVPLSRVLVVTFTRMATAELRERVRSRLVQTADALERAERGLPASGDDELCALLAAPDGIAQRRRNLLAALADFDSATISTIHGFCQQVLHGVGLVGDVEAEATFVEDERQLVESVCDDLLVQTFHGADPERPQVSRSQLLAIARAVVGNPDAVLVPDPADGPEAALRLTLARGLRSELDTRKRAARLLSYDDLLTRLAETLRHPAHGPAARARLREQFDIALIDEFQDTDPIQWDIFSRVFGDDATLVLIGDPKQAIYSFRGADVYAYLAAARDVAAPQTLDVNWRSDGDLLRAFNVLFQDAELGHPQILYRPVAPADHHRQSRLVADPAQAALRLRVVRRDAKVRLWKGAIVADVAREHIARDLAGEVVELLSNGARIRREHRDESEVRPGDLAVLVRRNADATLVRDALGDAGVPAVLNGVGSVFATPGATHWLDLLDALEHPARTRYARRVVLTPFFGWRASQVVEASEDTWARVHETLHQWTALLRERGVASLLRTVTLQQALPERILALDEGERLLTDIEHIGELLHAAAVGEQLGPSALAAWLRERIAEADQDLAPDERARRLESDAEAVQILTVHRSKGLEFPIVYCPFLWAAAGGWNTVPVFHDPETDDRRSIDVSGQGEPFGDHRKRAVAEQRGEDFRLLYVALTRARHQTVVWWAPASGSQYSPLAPFLFCRRQDGSVNTRGRPSIPNDDLTESRLADLVASAAGTITVEATPFDPVVTPWSGRTQESEDLDVRPFARGIDHRWRRTSYSALTAVDVDERRLVAEHEHELLDDESPFGAADAPDDGQSRLRDVACPLAGMPAGADQGTFVHRVLELVDFTSPDLTAALSEHIDDQQDQWPVSIGETADLATGLAAAVRTPLGPVVANRALCDIGRQDRLDEMGFELPLATGLDAAVTVAMIATVLRDHLPGDDPMAAYADELSGTRFQRAVRGFLTGSIDAILRTTDGDAQRFVVVDYKTNWLGHDGEPLTAWHYRPAALARAMVHGHYPLQALLYQVALHRYLRWRLPGYEAGEHLGGVLYLFVRGMTGPDGPTVDGRPCGVFDWRPPAELVLVLSDLLHEGGTA